MSQRFIYTFFVVLIYCIFISQSIANKHKLEELNSSENPTISFTFDDGSVSDMSNYSLEVWNEMILSSLKKHNIKAILFATGKFLTGEKGKYVLNSWNNAGHRIGNHSFKHYYFNSDEVSLNDFIIDLLKNDSIVKQYSNYIRLFRFPYLKEGNTVEKRDGFREFLDELDYQIGYVTVDASDWYVCSRLLKVLRKDSLADLNSFKDYYIQHLFNRAVYYDSLSTLLTKRKIKHNLLLHHNLTSALFLDDLINKFKSEGWDVIDADEAYKDPIYKKRPNILPAGESIIWSLAKESGNYDSILRYPAEDSRYEKAKMDSLGI
jgi:peptidoglycan/xylan/chitin deacetylase (PgdA/CDA1 family)